MRKIYLASSWRNKNQPAVLSALRRAGHQVYDFTNHTPHPGDDTPNTCAFGWRQVLDTPVEKWSKGQYLEVLQHPISERGFNSDFDAMKWANCCVLSLPCNRSAHLELGWFIGRGVPAFVLMDETALEFEPELMYKMCNGIFINTESLAAHLNAPLPIKHTYDISMPKSKTRKGK